MIKRGIILLVIFMALVAQAVEASQRVTLGVKLLGAGWKGDNGSGGTSFESSEGGQLGINAAYQNNNFYTGLSLQSGEYSFDDDAPDQFTTSGRVATSNEKVRQNDLDLLAGYYFWPKVSFFLDLKGVGNRWQSNGYEQSFGGLGLGITAHTPINQNWTIFGSLGFIGNGVVNDGDKNKVGDGKSSALEIGSVYSFNKHNSINMGLKFRSYNLKYSDGSNQDYSVNALFVGYNYTFILK